MTNAIDKITAHFRNKIGGDMKSIFVPEWDLTIWYKTTMTMKEQGKILEAASKGNQLEAVVEALIVKARKEDGSKLFAMPDKMTLMNEADSAVIIRIVAEMNVDETATFESLEEVEKN